MQDSAVHRTVWEKKILSSPGPSLRSVSSTVRMFGGTRRLGGVQTGDSVQCLALGVNPPFPGIAVFATRKKQGSIVVDFGASSSVSHTVVWGHGDPKGHEV